MTHATHACPTCGVDTGLEGDWGLDLGRCKGCLPKYQLRECDVGSGGWGWWLFTINSNGQMVHAQQFETAAEARNWMAWSTPQD